MADGITNTARAFLGQGFGMGWGDEAEAWVRSKLGDKPYEQALQQIRQEYAQYARENPGTAMGVEFAGGMAPAVGMMFIPGAQPAAVAQAQRSTAGALGRLAALGGATGAVSGAGSATEGERGTGAVVGGTLGTGLGLGVPIAIRGTKGAAQWLRDRLAPTEATIASRAGEKMTEAMRASDLTPQQIEQMMAKDRSMDVPSTVANVDGAMADLAEAVAQRTGKGTRKVEKTLTQQKTGARERTYQQVSKGLQPGDYYADEAKLVQDLRNKAGSMYDEAYAWGDVDDPKIMRALGRPELQSAYKTARDIAEAQKSLAIIRGEDPSKFDLPEIYKPTGKFTDSGAEVLELTKLPDVRTLDFMKRALDAQIKAGYASDNAAVKANTSTLKEIRNELRDTLKQNVPPYKKALSEYGGDMEVIDAMRAGMSDFGKLDSEQVIKLVSGMGNAEKEAFRTGVARSLYGTIMDPSTNFNAANRIINSPETTAKLQPLFDDPAHFRLFKAALEREAQLFQQSNKILGGSQTAKRQAMAEELDEGTGVGQAMVQGAFGNFSGALSGLATRFANRATITPQVADKLADMLMAKNPAEVASVVKFLEDYAAGQVPKAVKATAGEAGAVMGVTTSAFNPPAVEGETSGGIEAALPATPDVPDGESDLDREWRKMNAPQGQLTDSLK
jgi:hypothetical protein